MKTTNYHDDGLPATELADDDRATQVRTRTAPRNTTEQTRSDQVNGREDSKIYFVSLQCFAC